MRSKKRCSGKNVLQTESLASKIEHEDTILSEEIKRNTEIEQPTIEVENKHQKNQ